MPECDFCGETHATVNDAKWVGEEITLCPGCWSTLSEWADSPHDPELTRPICRTPGCDRYQEFPHAPSPYCLSHGLTQFFKWHPLAEFGPIVPGWGGENRA